MDNIKIIATDFDGTFLRSDKSVSKKNIETFINLKNKGYIIVGVSARNLLSVKSVVDVNLFDYIILNNGCDIYFVNEDKVEIINQIDKEVYTNIYNFYKNILYKVNFCTLNKYYTISSQIEDSRKFLEYINTVDEIDEKVNRMNLFFNNSKDLDYYKKELLNNYDSIDVIKMVDTDVDNSNVWICINPKNTNKLTTIKIICDKENLSLNNVIFFGDSENDLEMIKAAGVSVAMGNAIDAVKKNSKYVTLSNNNDGVAEFLNTYLK